MDTAPEISPIHQYVIDAIKNLRKEQDISQDKLAAYLGVDPSFIGHIEGKSSKYYNLDHINAIAFYLNVSPRELLPEKAYDPALFDKQNNTQSPPSNKEQ